MTEKTFSLEIIQKIKELKDGFELLKTEKEQLGKSLLEKQTLLSNCQEDRTKLQEKVMAFELREKTLLENEKLQDKLKYHLEFQKQRADEIKEIVGLVFRNPTIRKTSSGSVPIVNNGYQQGTATSSESSEETIV